MKKTEENEDNFKKYTDRMAQLRKEGGMVGPPDLPVDKLIQALCAEGFEILAEEAAKKAKKTSVPKKDDSEKLKDKLASTDKNPYVRARQIVLDKLPTWRRKEIEEMEKNGNTNNKIYSDFVAEVAKIGDGLPNP